MPSSTMTFILWLSLTLLQQPAAQQPTAPPATEVFVATLSIGSGTFDIGRPENISNSPGYDNQPFFTPDGQSLLFTSGRGELPSGGGAPQTDIYRYDFGSRQLTRVTDTTESEYSPTVTPDGQHISVIRVEADQTQRLWQFTRDGKSPSLVLADVKPVGYHAWLDENTLALFVLGQPATLQVADRRTGKAQVVASNIGQSVQKIPGGGVSFVQQSGQGSATTAAIVEVTLEKGRPVTRPLTAAVEGARQVHVAWTPDGTLLMAHGGSLHAWRRGEPTWRPVADLSRLGLRNVTRLAISPNADRIALVSQ